MFANVLKLCLPVFGPARRCHVLPRVPGGTNGTWKGGHRRASAIVPTLTRDTEARPVPASRKTRSGFGLVHEPRCGAARSPEGRSQCGGVRQMRDGLPCVAPRPEGGRKEKGEEEKGRNCPGQVRETIDMKRFSLFAWAVLFCLVGDVLPQYREKNISGAESDAVQALLARYLQRRLQGSQLSTPPPPAVLFSPDHRARVRQTSQRPRANSLPRNASDKDRPEDYEDYEDDLEGFEDSDRSRTRFDLLAVATDAVPCETGDVRLTWAWNV
ncbi:hypothetical protein KM043_010699 [Ampulex compressa]|nr:hypothetical protein KM043_010699 [Ampulex compressa]